MEKFHIGKNGPKECNATKRACRYGGSEAHYDNIEDANKDYEKQLAEEAGGSFNSIEHTEDIEANTGEQSEQEAEDEDTGDTAEKSIEGPESDSEKTIRYSFIEDFKERQKAFEADFGEYPKRFFNADLRGKEIPKDIDLKEVADELEEAISKDPSELNDYQQKKQKILFSLLPSIKDREIYGNMMHATSQPKENKEIPLEEAENLAKELGATNVRVIDSSAAAALAGKGATRGIIAEFSGGAKRPKYYTDEKGTKKFIPPKERDQYPLEDDKRFMVFTDKSNKKLDVYTVRREMQGITPNDSFVSSDLRSLAGAKRIHENTGSNLLQEVTVENRNPDAKYNENKIKSLRRLGELEDAQGRGKNFLDQAKYIKNHSGKVATAWMDKKNPDKTRQEMVKSSSFHVNNGGNFRNVEADNDVSPEEFKNFEDSYNEVKDKLPPIPADKRPELRIRKLGKHKANGIYFPHNGTIAIDVNTSEAFVHEYGHYLDLTVNNNASLNKDFREISKEYSRNLQVGDEKRREYLNTPTEQLARGFERYAVEKLGINNRLVNPDKFENDDHKPFSDPVLKKKVFAFFDKLFAQNSNQ